jgi:hypothetical protein
MTIPELAEAARLASKEDTKTEAAQAAEPLPKAAPAEEPVNA